MDTVKKISLLKHLKIAFIFSYVLFPFFLYAGGGGPTQTGSIKNGNETFCVGDLAFLTHISNESPYTRRWEYQVIKKNGERLPLQVIRSSDGTQHIASSAHIPLEYEGFVEVRVFSTTRNNKNYVTPLHTIKVLTAASEPGVISQDQYVLAQVTPVKIKGDIPGKVPVGNPFYSWSVSENQLRWFEKEKNTQDYSESSIDKTTYYRRITRTEFKGCISYSNIVRAEVVSVMIQGEEKEYCIGDSVSQLSLDISSSIEPQIQWEKKKDDAQWVTINGAQSRVYTPTEVHAGTYKYRAKVSWLSGTVSTYTDEKQEIFHAAAPKTSVDPEFQTVWSGVLPKELTLIGTSADSSYTYQWEKLNNSSNTWELISSATEPTYQAAVRESGNYRCSVSTRYCSAKSNTAEIFELLVNPGTIGHNATIGILARHKTLMGTSPYIALFFKWERRVTDAGGIWSNWSVVQDWSSKYTYTPLDPLPGVDGTLYQYRRWARIIPEDSLVSVNEVEILLSSIVPGSIFLPDSRLNLVCHDTIGKISEDPGGFSSEGTQKRFRWQVKLPGGSEWENLTDWGDSINLKDYYITSPVTISGIYAYRRQFVQDVSNKDDERQHRNSNEVSVWVEPLTGGKISIPDTILDLNDIPGELTSLDSGNGSYYQWQYRETIDGTWLNLTEWTSDVLSYTPSSPMILPFRQYRRLCKTLLSTSDDLAASSNVVTVKVQVVEPGFVAVGKPTIVRGGTAELVNVEQGTGTVFKWQVSRKLDDGSWGGWSTLGTEIFSAGKLGAKDENVRQESKYRRMCKSSLTELDLWASYTDEVFITVEPIKGGMIARSQTILKNGLPSKFTNVENSNGEAYLWVRKREGERDFRPITDFRFNEKEYQEVEPVSITTYYRRIAKPQISNDNRDTIASNTVVVTPSVDLIPGTIALSSSGATDTIVDLGTYLAKFYSTNNGNAIAFKWQKSVGDTWIDLTEWGNYVTYKDIAPVLETTTYRRCVKSHRTNSDDLEQHSNLLTVTVNGSLGGIVAGDTTINFGDLPGIFQNVTLGDGNLYKWQKKMGGNVWSDVTGWSSSNTDYIEKSPLLVTTYYRRLNRSETDSEMEMSSSNVITVTVLGVDVRDETIIAEDFYLALDEVLFGLTDELLIGRAQVRAMDNLSMLPVLIQTPVVHNIVNRPDTYEATFSTAKGESKTVKVYVTENFTSDEYTLLFAHDFTVYSTESLESLTDDVLLFRGGVRGYDLTTQEPVSVMVKDRTALDLPFSTTPPTSGTYPVIFGYLGVMISANVTITEGQTLQLSFDVNFSDGNNQNKIDTIDVNTGKSYGELPLPIRAGSEFLYWSLDVKGLTPIESTTIVGSLPGTEIDHTLYAIWKYPVTLDLNDGTGDSIIFVQQYRPYQYFQSLPIPQRRGYRFVGWSLNADGSYMIEGTTVVEDQNEHTLYAIWEAREITVIFNASGGTASPDRKIVTFGSSYGEFPVVRYGNYKLKGWVMADGKEVFTTTTIDTMALEIVLYAQYQTYNMADDDRYILTPNSDGLNDRFYLQFLWLNKEDVKDVNVCIYDRKGLMVYQHKDYQRADGDFDGANLPDGTYIVAVHYIHKEEKKVYNATVTILR